MIELLLGLAPLLGTALLYLGVWLLATFLVAAVIEGVSSWLNSAELQQVGATKGVSLKSEVVQNMIEDAKNSTMDYNKIDAYNKLQEALREGCQDYENDIITMGQNNRGDVVAATSFSAQDVSHQYDDARDYVIASDKYKNVSYKQKLWI